MRWTHVIVHHSATADTVAVERDSIENYHVNMRHWRAIGYHRVYELIGDRYHALEGRPLMWVGSHSPGYNGTALGVCFVGDFSEAPPPDLQLETGAIDIAGLCYLAEIPISNILKHSDVRQTECPGLMFPFDHLIERVSHWIGTS